MGLGCEYFTVKNTLAYYLKLESLQKSFIASAWKVMNRLIVVGGFNLNGPAL
jgi:hypothetical protein